MSLYFYFKKFDPNGIYIVCICNNMKLNDIRKKKSEM